MSPNLEVKHEVVEERSDGADEDDDNEKRKLLVQQSWGIIATSMGSKGVSKIFERLFQEHPQVERLFRGVDMALQSQKLFLTLQVTVRFLGNMKELTPMLEEMGVRHALQYGVITAHYHALTNAFLETIEACFKTQGPQQPLSWNEETREAWAWALDQTITIMMRAADREVKKLCNLSTA